MAGSAPQPDRLLAAAKAGQLVIESRSARRATSLRARWGVGARVLQVMSDEQRLQAGRPQRELASPCERHAALDGCRSSLHQRGCGVHLPLVHVEAGTHLGSGALMTWSACAAARLTSSSKEAAAVSRRATRGLAARPMARVGLLRAQGRRVGHGRRERRGLGGCGS